MTRGTVAYHSLFNRQQENTRQYIDVSIFSWHSCLILSVGVSRIWGSGAIVLRWQYYLKEVGYTED